MFNFKAFLTFKKMVSPIIIQVFFWILLAMLVATSIMMMLQKDIWQGLAVLILGPIFLRVGAESVLVFFRIYEEVKK